MKYLTLVAILVTLCSVLLGIAFEQSNQKGGGGDVDAQFILGFAYEKGKRASSKDDKEAVKWYTKAAEQGHAVAQYALGVAYYYGEGVLKDFKEAVKWWTKAAEQGIAKAQLTLHPCTKTAERSQRQTGDGQLDHKGSRRESPWP